MLLRTLRDGLSDLFANATNALVPPPVPPKSEADLDRSKDEIVRRLTEELVHTRQRNKELESRHHEDIQAKKSAELHVRELEDVIALKNGMFDALERQIVLLEKHVANLQRKEAELNALRAEQAEQPVSASDVAHRYEQLSDLFTQLQDTLTCPVCYEPFGRGQAVSLQCGHTFCQTCYSEWEHRHVEAWKVSPQQGVYLGPECPECRTTDVRRGRVRIYSLEEVVRLVERGKREIAAHPYTPAIQDAIQPITGTDLLLRHQHVAKHDGDTNDDDDHAQSATAVTATSQLTGAERDLIILDADRDDPVVMDLAQTQEITLEDPEDPATAAVTAPADASIQGAASRPSAAPAGDEAPQHPVRTLCDTPLSSAAAADSEDTISAPMPASPPPPAVGPASSDSTPSSTTTLPSTDASRLSLEETYLRERAAARARAREAELRLEAELAARRAEEEEREAREAREQLLVERGRRPYAVGGAIRETP